MWPEILAENACKGLGKLGELMLGKYFRQKEYQDFLMRAQAEKDALAIASDEKVFDGEKLLPAWDLSHMPASSLPHQIGLEEESNNLNAALRITADILKDTPEEKVSDEAVDSDWFTRWRREACVVGNPEMRQLWGRILAEEIKSPQTISLKTLDILKNISKADADLFCKIARFRINDLIPTPEKAPQIYTLSNIIQLQDIGLVGENFLLSPGTVTSGRSDQILICNGFVLCLDLSSTIQINIPGVRISRAGKEIISIADTIPPATAEEIKIIGDMVWETLPKRRPKMTAHTLVSSGEFSIQELARWSHKKRFPIPLFNPR